jgi:hypothetical protein
MNKTKGFYDEVRELWVQALLLSVVFVPIGILGWQTFNFLESGIWLSFSILDLLDCIAPAVKWVSYPQEWKGLHKVFGWLHGSVGTVFISVFLIVWAVPN